MRPSDSHAFILPRGAEGVADAAAALDKWGADVITPLLTEPDGSVRPLKAP